MSVDPLCAFGRIAAVVAAAANALAAAPETAVAYERERKACGKRRPCVIYSKLLLELDRLPLDQVDDLVALGDDLGAELLRRIAHRRRTLLAQFLAHIR